jgi:hypothetical protein
MMMTTPGVEGRAVAGSRVGGVEGAGLDRREVVRELFDAAATVKTTTTTATTSGHYLQVLMIFVLTTLCPYKYHGRDIVLLFSPGHQQRIR